MEISVGRRSRAPGAAAGLELPHGDTPGTRRGQRHVPGRQQQRRYRPDPPAAPRSRVLPADAVSCRGGQDLGLSPGWGGLVIFLLESLLFFTKKKTKKRKKKGNKTTVATRRVSVVRGGSVAPACRQRSSVTVSPGDGVPPGAAPGHPQRGRILGCPSQNRQRAVCWRDTGLR